MAQACVQNHSRCGQRSNPVSELLPKRILRISPDNKFKLSLHESNSEREPYAILSHCWGSGVSLKTTMANLSNMKHNVTWSALSQTFRDAVSISHQLGIHYIWIDALCIIQDNDADWELESAKMGDYYRRAFVTIAASSSIHGETSFLKDRDPPTEFLIRDPIGNKLPVYVRKYCGQSTNELFAPLGGRAWAWQEHVLSTRIIHFTEGEIIWECKSDIRSEVGQLSKYLERKIGILGRQLESDPRVHWYYLIEDYSARLLTYPRDKLPAVSGVAAEIQKITGSRYLAGLWHETLSQDLLWEVPGTSTQRQLETDPSQFISPSWSWASAQSGVKFIRTDFGFRFAFEILDAQRIVPGLNPFGEVASGYIKLRGYTFAAELTCQSPRVFWGYKLDSVGLLSNSTVHPDCALEKARGLSVRRLTRGGEKFRLPVTCLYLGEEYPHVGYVMILGQSVQKIILDLGFFMSSRGLKRSDLQLRRK